MPHRLIGNGTQPAQNRQHALDDATGEWVKVGRGGRYENFEGWAITKIKSGPDAGRWLVTRPGGAPMRFWSHGRPQTEPSLSWAKAGVYNALREGWTSEGVTELGEGQRVERWTHASGAIVDDNTANDGGMTDMSPAELAELAWVGHRVDGAWEQFATFAAAAAFALGEEA